MADDEDVKDEAEEPQEDEGTDENAPVSLTFYYNQELLQASCGTKKYATWY